MIHYYALTFQMAILDLGLHQTFNGATKSPLLKDRKDIVCFLQSEDLVDLKTNIESILTT